MSQDLWNAALPALAAPLLAGDRLRWFLVLVVAAGVVVSYLLLRSGRKPSKKQEPPMTKPRLLPHDDD